MINFDIVNYDEKDRDSCIDLLKRTFGEASNEKTFNWRFESYSQQKPLLICAKHNDKVVSFNSWLPWEFTYNSEKLLGYQSGESATDKEYRRKGIWGKVLKYADKIALERKIDFLFGFPSGMSYNAFYKAGYHPIVTFYSSIRLINPFKKKIKAKTDYHFNDFLPPIIEKNKITPLFDLHYFEWRYLKNPNNYDIIKFCENNNQAIFILRKGKYYNKRYKIKINQITLVDCQFTSFNDVFISNAFKYLDKIYSGKALYMRTFFNNNTDRGRAISNHFKRKIKSWFEILCIKPINKNLDYNLLFNYNNWDILPHLIDVY